MENIEKIEPFLGIPDLDIEDLISGCLFRSIDIESLWKNPP